MKILSTSSYRKMVNLIDTISERLETEKCYVSRLMHENKALQMELDRLKPKRDKTGKFAPKNGENHKPLATISAKFYSDSGAKVRISGERLTIKYLLMKIKSKVEND